MNATLKQKNTSLVMASNVWVLLPYLYRCAVALYCHKCWGELFGAPRQWKHFRPLFQAVFLSGGHYPPDWVKHHASQSQGRNNKYCILYIEFCINNNI